MVRSQRHSLHEIVWCVKILVSSMSKVIWLILYQQRHPAGHAELSLELCRTILLRTMEARMEAAVGTHRSVPSFLCVDPIEAAAEPHNLSSLIGLVIGNPSHGNALDGHRKSSRRRQADN